MCPLCGRQLEIINLKQTCLLCNYEVPREPTVCGKCSRPLVVVNLKRQCLYCGPGEVIGRDSYSIIFNDCSWVGDRGPWEDLEPVP